MPTFEVWEQGVVRFADLRRAIGKAVLGIDRVVVVALVADLGVVRQELPVVEKLAGSARHRLFGCPECHAPVAVLRWHVGLGFRCARCRPHRTDRQRYRSTDRWRTHGGKEMDELLRVAAKRRAPRRTSKMEQLVEKLIDVDKKLVDEAMSQAASFLIEGPGP